MAVLHRLTAVRLADMVRKLEVSSTEVVGAFLDRMGSVNGSVNAVVTLAEDAMDQARAADESLAKGEYRGPLHGVPVTIKDSIATKGLRTTAGYPPLAGYVPDEDATVVARLKAAGAIVMGKTNLSTLTIDCRSENPVFGRTNNPWNTALTAGGSSCGSAAAVAAGMSPLDLGSDNGGSIRIPAHFCGVYGFKPTAQRVSLHGHIPDLPGSVRVMRMTGTIGPLAGSVDDLYTVFRVIAGCDGRDFDVPPVPVRTMPDTPDPKGLRIAWARTLPGVPVSSGVSGAVARFAETLEGLGCRVEETCPRIDFDAQFEAFWGNIGFVFAGAQRYYGLEGGDNGQPPPSVLDVMDNLHRRDGFIRQWEGFLGEWDAFMLPTVMLPAFPHYESGAWVPLDDGMLDSGRINNHCCLFNYTGHPAVVLPLALDGGGLPMGLQLVGRRWNDEGLLAVAKALSAVIGPIGVPSLRAW